MKKPPAKRSPQPNSQPHTQRHEISVQQHTWQAPLPPPSVLDDFNSVVPGSAERIIRAWEVESDHRREIDRREQRWFYLNALTGKVFAFIFVMAALGLSAWAMHLDRPWLAGILAGTTLAAVVGAFVHVEKRNKQ